MNEEVFNHFTNSRKPDPGITYDKLVKLMDDAIKAVTIEVLAGDGFKERFENTCGKKRIEDAFIKIVDSPFVPANMGIFQDKNGKLIIIDGRTEEERQREKGA